MAGAQGALRRAPRRSLGGHDPGFGDDTLLVSVADKLDNARAILRDYRERGDELWQRFSVKDPEKHLWYYKSLLEVYQQRNTTWLVDELERVIVELEAQIRSGV